MDIDFLRSVRRDLQKAKKKLARAQALQRRAEKGIRFWESRVLELQHQRQAVVQTSLWSDSELAAVQPILYTPVTTTTVRSEPLFEEKRQPAA
jgi:hypothetical protein